MSVRDVSDPARLTHGGDIYRNDVRLDFSVNLNPMPAPASLAEAIRRGAEAAGCYPDPLQSALRREVAALDGVAPGQVLCGNGASELLMAAVHALRPKEVLLTAPCYAGYRIALQAADPVLSEYPLDESKAFSLDEGILDEITGQTDLLILTDPNNPDGKRIDPELLRRIVRRCEELDVRLLLDECFLPLSEGPGYQRLFPGVLHLRAFTKTFAVPGVRIGYLVCSEEDCLVQIRRHLPEWNVSVIADAAGREASRILRETDYLKRSAAMIREERAWLAAELTRLGAKVYPGEANYLLLRGGKSWYGKLLARGILLRDCSDYHGLGAGFYRVAVRAHEENRELISALKKIQEEE
ncbi:MAG: aminotransferase class I/II-fold pyridoxal phosphate-dependent enzyme [Mogibacterium sp.]|nr:aminotransferase class I/II-fold pyridoxal phosphate-dependent enzyme [Mogibacterium sp.]